MPLDTDASLTAGSEAGRAPCHPGVALMVLQPLCQGFGRGGTAAGSGESRAVLRGEHGGAGLR